MTELDFSTIHQALDALTLPEADLVIGIATGGVVPAALVARRLNCELRVLQINYRDDANQPRYDVPRVLSGLRIPNGTRRILVVDDVSVSGSTLETARGVLSGYEITTLVMKGKADMVVFSDIKTCVQWPWKPVDQTTALPEIA